MLRLAEKLDPAVPSLCHTGIKEAVVSIRGNCIYGSALSAVKHSMHYKVVLSLALRYLVTDVTIAHICARDGP